MTSRTYKAGDELPYLTYEWRDSSGALIDLSTGWTFTTVVTPVGSSTATFTKTTGHTGAATSPNLTVEWAVADLGALTAGMYRCQTTARRISDSKDRSMPEVQLIIT
jgi:hypothetical protein